MWGSTSASREATMKNLAQIEKTVRSLHAKTKRIKTGDKVLDGMMRRLLASEVLLVSLAR